MLKSENQSAQNRYLIFIINNKLKTISSKTSVVMSGWKHLHLNLGMQQNMKNKNKNTTLENNGNKFKNNVKKLMGVFNGTRQKLSVTRTKR